LAQFLQRLPLEGVEGVRRAIFEGVVREKAELGVAVATVDQAAEFQRQGRRDRNGTWHLRIVGQHLRLLTVSEHAPDHVAGVIVADAVDHRREFVGLLAQRAFREIA
jgi:hypothetical protein